jgi:hypothetical protein
MTSIKSDATFRSALQSDNPVETRPIDCSRCGGLLVRSYCISPDQGAWEFQIPVCRCLQCGDVIDPTILKHRRQPPHHAHN